jgi:hypothetical protein
LSRPQDEYSVKQDGYLLKACEGHNRIPWKNITKEYNEKFKEDRSKDAIRARVRLITGNLQNGRILQGDEIMDARLHSDEVNDNSEELLEAMVQPKFPDIKVPEFQWEEWYEVADRLGDMTNKADPTMTAAKVQLNTSDPIALMHVGDWHLGSRFVAYKTFRALLDLTMATERVFWGLYGDDADLFPLGWLPPAMGMVITPVMQRRLVSSIANELTKNGKALWSFWGNHDGFDEKQIGESLITPIWQGNIPYFHGKGVIRLQVGENEYIIYGAHAFKGSSIYNVNHAQMRALLWEVPQADFVVMGHKHTFGYAEVPHHEQAYLAGLHQSRMAHLLQIGSPKTGPDRYTIRGWSQGIFEWPIFVLYPDEHKIKRAYDFEDLEHFLGVTIDKSLLEALEEAARLEGES